MRLILLFIALVAVSCSENNIDIKKGDSSTDIGSTSVTDDATANTKIDNYLKTYYLYNEEYRKLSPNFDLLYSDFLESSLKSMSTNKLDYKNGKLYSFVTRNEKSRSGSRSSATKELTMSFGLASAMLISFDDSDKVMIGIQAVYPDSPAEEAGLKRGYVITKVGDVELSSSNAYGYAQLLLSPTSASTLSLAVQEGKRKFNTEITARGIYPNPVLKCEVINGTTGYLNYLSFDMAYDSELIEAISSLKNAGITNLILDLRLNGGGHVESARKLATSIAGANCSGKIFQKFRYNSDLMAMSNTLYPKQEGFSLSGVPQLSLPKLYCLVSGRTASASEIIINSLRGIDFPVTLIGEQTNGKNVGMFEFDFSTDEWDYKLLPISFQNYNAKDFGAYENGFAVNYAVDDWDGGSNFTDFTSSDVMIAKALSLISGGASRACDHISTNELFSATPAMSVEQIRSPSCKSGSIILNP